MFLSSNYILANELVEKMGIHIANISMLRQKFEDGDDFSTIKKLNNCSFINTKSHKLPNNITVGILTNTFTDISDKLPCTFVKSEYLVSERELFNSGVAVEKIKIAGKDFYTFDSNFVSKVNRKIVYTLNKAETMECFERNQIDGFIQVSKNKFLTWY